MLVRVKTLAVIGLSLLATIAAPALAQEATPAPPPAGCTAGSSGIGDPYFPLLGNSGYDVQHYSLDLDLDLDVVGGAIASARATIEAVALLNLCTFNLDFRGLILQRQLACRLGRLPYRGGGGS